MLGIVAERDRSPSCDVIELLTKIDLKNTARANEVNYCFPVMASHFDITESGNNELSAHRNLDATPKMKELNYYVSEMAQKYNDIGLELDIDYSQLKAIRDDVSLHNDRKKCLEMLDVWLKNDRCATWNKLCEALQKRHIGLNVLAVKIAQNS